MITETNNYFIVCYKEDHGNGEEGEMGINHSNINDAFRHIKTLVNEYGGEYLTRKYWIEHRIYTTEITRHDVAVGVTIKAQ